MLDLESVRLFIFTAELGNFTRAAEAAGTVQPVVSQRLKSLEERLGRKLLERTPRYVRLTAEGFAFLERARILMRAHDAAITVDEQPATRISIGASDHALGVGIERILGRLQRALPRNAAVEIRLGRSQAVREAFDAGEIDMAVIRREGAAVDGEVLGLDPLGWRGSEHLKHAADGTIPLAVLAPPCGVREVALRSLDRAGLRWREAFVGGSCTVLLAAVRAGVGVAPMGRLASGNAPDRGPELGLPPLPASQIVLLARAASAHMAEAIRILAAGVRADLS